jgi:hypothetical protein
VDAKEYLKASEHHPNSCGAAISSIECFCAANGLVELKAPAEPSSALFPTPANPPACRRGGSASCLIRAS